MAAIKILCIANLQKPLGVPSCPPQEDAQPLRGLWQEEGKQPTAPAGALAALQALSSLCSPLHPVWWGSGSLSPLQPLVPTQDTSLCWSLQCKGWLQRTYRALSYIHNHKSHNDFRNAEVSGCARLVGRWEMEMLSLSGWKGQDRNWGVAECWAAHQSRACTFISSSTKLSKTLTPTWAPGHGCNVNINTNEAFLLSLCTCCFPSLAVWEMACPTCWGPQKIVFI